MQGLLEQLTAQVSALHVAGIVWGLLGGLLGWAHSLWACSKVFVALHPSGALPPPTPAMGGLVQQPCKMRGLKLALYLLSVFFLFTLKLYLLISLAIIKESFVHDIPTLLDIYIF